MPPPPVPPLASLTFQEHIDSAALLYDRAMEALAGPFSGAQMEVGRNLLLAASIHLLWANQWLLREPAGLRPPNPLP